MKSVSGMTELRARLRDAHAMLERCRAKFADYAEQHRAKNTPEATRKALANEAMVLDIREVLKT